MILLVSLSRTPKMEAEDESAVIYLDSNQPRTTYIDSADYPSDSSVEYLHTKKRKPEANLPSKRTMATTKAKRQNSMTSKNNRPKKFKQHTPCPSPLESRGPFKTANAKTSRNWNNCCRNLKKCCHRLRL